MATSKIPQAQGPKHNLKTLRWAGLIGMLILIVGVIYVLESSDPRQSRQAAEDVAVHMGDTSFAEKQAMYEPGKEITTPDGFINVEDISVGELIGEKVILIDFWTYSCINCQRTTPFLNAWYDAYADQGLEIIGIHTPEFAFEEKYENVQAAVEEFGIEFPVVLDNDYSTWRAYENRFWPRKYLIDIDGFIVYDHIGEGAYDETEAKIQELLAERASRLGEEISGESASVTGAVDVDFSQVGTREIYFGSARNEHLGNGVQDKEGLQTLSEPEQLADSTLYLVGDWDFDPEFAESVSPGKIVINYDAKEVYFVASADEPVTVRVLLDGEPLDESVYGVDVVSGPAGASMIEISDERLYHVVSGEAYGPHLLEIYVEGEGLQAFTFTFG